MANILPHIDDSSGTTFLPPKGDYETFVDEANYEEKVREWGLSVKKEYWYKERTHQQIVTIKGYEVYGKTQEHNTIVLEFEDGNLTCIHPAYLKEMQSPSFAKTAISDTGVVPLKKQETANETKAEKPAATESKSAVKKEQAEKKTKKEKAPKIELPTDKVHFTASVKQIALTWNHFNEDNDEVIILENVVILQEEPIELGLAWCSHSKTLKKLDLEPGNTLEFDAKVVKKKLAKGKDVDEEFIIENPVHYKINNPSKLKKS
ncbi:hypothetical protein [Bacillus sp. JJ1562]|uniref:hypothetical protein n=1 Tax=Bacillus sp. JJ1562 TaxID=3122960 RepID=UPI003001C272